MIWKLLVGWMLTMAMQPHTMLEDPHPYISRLTSCANWIATKLLYMYVCNNLASYQTQTTQKIHYLLLFDVYSSGRVVISIWGYFSIIESIMV